MICCGKNNEIYVTNTEQQIIAESVRNGLMVSVKKANKKLKKYVKNK